MAGSVNKVTILGHLGKDPEIRTMSNGSRVATFSVATSVSWKDKNTGERQERTEWHKVVVFNEGLVGIIERYLHKGSKVYLEGALQTRKYEKDGRDVYTTEIVLKPYRGELTMLSSRQSGENGDDERMPPPGGRPGPADLDDEIPF